MCFIFKRLLNNDNAGNLYSLLTVRLMTEKIS